MPVDLRSNLRSCHTLNRIFYPVVVTAYMTVLIEESYDAVESREVT